MRYIINTLGCKVNQYETQAIDTLLRERGHELADSDADAVIINTCAVTAESGRKSRQAVRRAKNENPNAVIAVCGCFSQVSPDEVRALDADIIYGSGDRAGLVIAVENAVNDRSCIEYLDDPFKRLEFENLPAGSVSGRTRAMLKIEDGCDNFCSYCIIPYARGRVRSLSPEDAATQAAELEGKGYRELVITGIEISSYGKDFHNNTGLADVIEKISVAAPGLRLRLGSLEPTIITREFCRRISDTGSVCGHFHLSLQSGSDATLKAMRRKYDTGMFFEATQLLREYFHDCAFTADLITGFPGETEQHHLDTLEFIEKCGFSSMHIFPYSIRPGTKAADMDGQIEKSVKARRAHEAQEIAEKMKRKYLESCIGKSMMVLFETCQEGICTGHADNYCEVSAAGEHARGIVKSVEITGISGEMLVGKVI